MNKQVLKQSKRSRRHARVRSVVSGTGVRPRLSVYRSLSHIYAQLIDDVSGKTLASASSQKTETSTNKTEVATKVGQSIAEKAAKLNISEVVFDRGGQLYHGRVKALAEAARAAGLKF